MSPGGYVIISGNRRIRAFFVQTELQHPRRHRERSVAIQSLTAKPVFVALDCHASLAMTTEDLCVSVKQ
jgi:hypothetical protein